MRAPQVRKAKAERSSFIALALYRSALDHRILDVPPIADLRPAGTGGEQGVPHRGRGAGDEYPHLVAGGLAGKSYGVTAAV